MLLMGFVMYRKKKKKEKPFIKRHPTFSGKVTTCNEVKMFPSFLEDTFFLSSLTQGRKFDVVTLVLALGSTIALLAIVSLTTVL